jgi:hypothetical protein
MGRESAFSSRLRTWPVVRIQGTRGILWVKNSRLALAPTQGDGPLRSHHLPMCMSTKSQLTALLFTHEHPMRFDFVVDL